MPNVETSNEISSSNALKKEPQISSGEVSKETVSLQNQDAQQTIGKIALERDKALSEAEKLRQEVESLKASSLQQENVPTNLSETPKEPEEKEEEKKSVDFSSYPKEMQDVMIRETVGALGYSKLTNDEINSIRQFVESDGLSVEKAFHLLLGQSVIEQNQKESVSGVPYESEAGSPESQRKAVEDLSMEELQAEMQRIKS